MVISDRRPVYLTYRLFADFDVKIGDNAKRSIAGMAQ
jgi:hypothetical protein